MYIHVSSKKTEVAGPAVTFDCPVCGKLGVVGRTSEVTEVNTLFWVIPLFTACVRYVMCPECCHSWRTGLSLEQLGTIAREDLTRQLAVEVPFLVRFCIVLGLVAACVPIFGLVMAVVGTVSTRRCRSGWRTAALVALALSAIGTAVVICMGSLPRSPDPQ